jgi:hypothetical protein
MLLKLVAFGFNYFKSSVNCFDMVRQLTDDDDDSDDDDDHDAASTGGMEPSFLPQMKRLDPLGCTHAPRSTL